MTGRFGRALTLAIALTACRGDSPPAPAPAPAPTPAPAPAPAPTPAAAPAPATAPLPLDRLSQEGWYGIYMMGRKVGHGHMWVRPSRADEPGAYAYGFAMQMSVSGGGQDNLLALSESRFYGPDHPHPLVETRFSTSARGFSDERRAVPTAAGKMRITRTLGDKEEPAREVEGTREDLVAQLALTPLELAPAEVGKQTRVSLWSWEREADEAITVEFVSIDQRVRAGIAEQVGRFALTYDATGVKGEVLVGGDGTMLEMTLGSSLLLKLEERAVAQSGVSGLDILGTGVPSPARLGPPDRVARLRLDVVAPAGLTLPATAARKVERLEGGADGKARWRLTLTRGFSDEVTAEARAAALAADATIDATHPAIAEHARALVAGIDEPRARVDKIADWVFQALDKKLATHLPTASTVLEQKVGDCTEHTWLTVALLRALAVPARPVYGIAYTGDAESLFAYHAWVEVALPDAAGVERWLAIDPTWGEREADATHIALGSSLGEVAGSIGGLVIEAAEVLPE